MAATSLKPVRSLAGLTTARQGTAPLGQRAMAGRRVRVVTSGRPPFRSRSPVEQPTGQSCQEWFKEKAFTTGTFRVKIESMINRGLIRERSRESDDEIPHFGNAMAQGETNEAIDENLAEVLAPIDEVVNVVSQSHASLAKVREKRPACKTGTSK